MKKFACLVLALGAFAPLSASARPYHVTPVSWIVATRNNIDVDDRYVTIIGHVTRRMGDEEYWFSDGTGSVRLDSENFDLPVGPRLVIGGRIDQAYLGFGHIEVDVRHWHYAPVVHHAPVHTVVVTRTVAVPAASALVPTPTPAASTPPPAPAPATAPAPSQPASTNPAPVSQTAPASTNATPLTPPAESH
jgi:hypothetical protein